MRLTLECLGSFLLELNRSVRAVCSREYVYITFQDDLIVIQDETVSPSSWVEIDIATQTFFKKYDLKSKAPKNRIIFKSILSVFLEALQASSALSGTKVAVKLAAFDNRVYLEFKCEVPEEDESFSYEKQVEVIIEKGEEDIVPDIPNVLECELPCIRHLQQMVLPLTNELTLVQICLTVDNCNTCKAKDKRDLDYVFGCTHSRKNYKLPETGKLTVMSQETSPLQVVSSYYNLPLQPGQSSLFNIKSLIKAKDLVQIFQKTSSLNWNKVMLGIQHESEIIITASWKESLRVKLMASGFTQE
jgi:hypothetical protein